MPTLVTGAGGFLGRHLVQQLLARGHRVRAFCRHDHPELAREDVKVIHGDLTDPTAVSDACRGIDVVFHTAGMAGIWGSWKPFYAANTLGTRCVIEACRRHRVAKLVFTSSPSVTFDGRSQEGVDESAPYPREWLCHYAHTKALAEQDVLRANGRDGLATCALRPHLIWGPDDPHLCPRIIERARSGRLRRVGDGTNRIDTIYVENAAEAHLLAADALGPGSPVAGRAYFLSQGEPVNCWEWIDRLLGIAGLPPVHGSISLAAAWRWGAAIEWSYRLLGIHREPPMTRFLAAQLGNSHYFDIRRARTDFGYEPRVSTEEGLRRMAGAMRQTVGQAVPDSQRPKF
ncbi:MAG TPA: NAD-dependent epimerase/dehydratase family protein [Thermoguttaceae bacterium]|nr:NAD-dependent epimerase/dehydratase family protein [Thermoguttaceae bacterium]